MNDKRYLLYIDILGFKELVKKHPEKITQLYNVIDNLNVHNDNAFKTIVFSDTILVYNKVETINEEHHKEIVMFSCEFAQDLLHRCAQLNIHFRAILTYGRFHYEKMKNIEAYHGGALVEAYLKESTIVGLGLFIDKRIANMNNIFPMVTFDESFNFVFILQQLKSVELFTGGVLPLRKDVRLVDICDLRYLKEELNILHNYWNGVMEQENSYIRAKFLQTYFLYKSMYPELITRLEVGRFTPETICPDTDWSEFKT